MAAGAIDCVLKGEGEAAVAAPARGDRARRRRSGTGARRGHRGRRGAAAGLRPLARRAAAGARPAAPPPQVFHRRARSLRLDRVLARLPVGLLVLQRLDLLRPQLSAGQPGARSPRTSRSIREPGVFIVDDVAFIQRAARPRDRRGDRARAASASATTSRRAATCCCATRRSSGAGSGSGSSTCSSASRRSTRRACSASASASRSAATSRRSSSRARSASRSRSTSSPTPTGTRARSQTVREWCLDDARDRQHQRQHALSRAPRAGSPTRGALTTRDYRLFDIQHAVLPTRLPLAEFYDELVKTQRVIYRKHLGWRRCGTPRASSPRLLLRGQTNFVRSLFSFNRVYRPGAAARRPRAPVKYADSAAAATGRRGPRRARSISIAPRGRKGRAIDRGDRALCRGDPNGRLALESCRAHRPSEELVVNR